MSYCLFCLTEDQNLFDKADKEYRSAERDNDMIYHQDIPSSSSLEPIAGIALAVGVIPKGIEDPKVILSKNAEDVIFGDLPSWGAQGAIGEHKSQSKPSTVD
jgi:programmed cell death 6-interacting protein